MNLKAYIRRPSLSIVGRSPLLFSCWFLIPTIHTPAHTVTKNIAIKHSSKTYTQKPAIYSFRVSRCAGGNTTLSVVLQLIQQFLQIVARTILCSVQAIRKT